jgi:hypothetical protein
MHLILLNLFSKLAGVSKLQGSLSWQATGRSDTRRWALSGLQVSPFAATPTSSLAMRRPLAQYELRTSTPLAEAGTNSSTPEG